MNLKVSSCAVLFFLIAGIFTSETFAQNRPRVAGNNGQTSETATIPAEPKQPTRTASPVLTNPIVVVGKPKTTSEPLVKKTGSSRPVNAPNYNNSAGSLAAFNQRLKWAMDQRLGIRYHYGSDGPNSYDCSGLVWAVFTDAGASFARTSAASYYNTFEPVYGDDRFKFGTLVFFNRLGHVGIVVDDKGFYQASSSKGVTYSKFEGYWEKRIVGFRRVPLGLN